MRRFKRICMAVLGVVLVRERQYAAKLVELAEGLRSFVFVKNNSLFLGDLVSTEAEVAAASRIPLPRAEPEPAAE